MDHLFCTRNDARRALALASAAMKPLRGLTTAFGEPGDDLLFRALRHSTIGAGAFHCRVRDGIGWFHTAIATRLAKNSAPEGGRRKPEIF